MRRLLVANRGEIALRIFRACAAESIETVSIRLEATDVRVTEVRLVWVPVD